MVDQVQRGHGWLAHTLQRFRLLTWVQKNAPTLKQYAHNLGKPALSVGTNLAKAVFSTILALTTIAFLSLFMLLEAPRAADRPARHHEPELRGDGDGRVGDGVPLGDGLRARDRRPWACSSGWWSWSPC